MTADPQTPVEWRSIPGWPYEASDKGHIRNEETGKILAPILDKKYHRVHLWRGGEEHERFWVHRLVLRAFEGPPPTDKHQVNHIDGDKTNNAVANLEWVTQEENAAHAIESGLWDPSMASAKLSSEEVVEIRERYAAGGVNLSELGREYDVTCTHVGQIVRGEKWSHIGGPITKETASQSGERNHGSSLTPEKARSMREKYADDPQLRQSDLADEHGVSVTTVSRVLRGESWVDAGGPITKTGAGGYER